MISEELRLELQKWLTWVENGAPEGKPFTRSFDIGGNIHFLSGKPNVGNELENMFDSPYFFGKENFKQRSANETHHECPDCLVWVRNILSK